MSTINLRTRTARALAKGPPTVPGNFLWHLCCLDRPVPVRLMIMGSELVWATGSRKTIRAANLRGGRWEKVEG